jgi:hypothetical protein
LKFEGLLRSNRMTAEGGFATVDEFAAFMCGQIFLARRKILRISRAFVGRNGANYSIALESFYR